MRARLLRLLPALSIALGLVAVTPQTSAAFTGVITEYPVPTPSSSLGGIAAGPDGNVWFVEFIGNNVGRITPSGVITEYPLPVSGARPHSIVTGPDGNLWVTEALGNKVGRLTPAGGWSEFTATTTSSEPWAITVGPDGGLWFTEYGANKIGKVTTTGTFTEYPIPSVNSEPNAIAAGPEGNLWFTEQGANKIGRITPAGTITEFPTPNSSGTPLQITTGPDGNLWYTDTSASKVGKVTPAGSFTEYPLSSNSYPVGIANGPDGNLWVTENNGNNVDRVTIAGSVTQYPIPTASSGPDSIATGPDNNLWFTENVANQIGRLEVAPQVVLPAMANAAYGGYTTVAEVQNIGSAPASVYIHYFDSSGNPVGSGDSIVGLPVNGTWTVRQDNGHSFPAGGAGSAKIYSSQPVDSFVNEFAPGNVGDATSYTGIDPTTGSGSTVVAPTIVRNAYGGYTTGIGLINTGLTPTNVLVTYRDALGSTVKTQALSGIAPGAYQALYSGDVTLNLPDGFAGTATLASSNGPIAAIVNETGPGGQFSSYDAVTSAAAVLYAPAALNNAYGGYNTGFAIQNLSGVSGTVTINYYSGSGVASTTSKSIPAYGYVGVYQGTDIPSAGAYTAKISSTVPIAGIVNETAPSATTAKQSTAYDMTRSGGTAIHLPLVESAGADGWSTGEGVMNTGLTPTTVTVTYYDTVSGAQVGTPDIQTVQPNAFWGLYQPAGGLPTGHSASAIVTTSGGAVAVICNESNSSSFMSYSGQ